ncbi:MAG: hypothetical protein MUC48_08120 [Leptolyngbya sp. Prado105]|jgi:hypothetical protein|nr:hypothetical protein [Leptolyngbya sp. Prado105]
MLKLQAIGIAAVQALWLIAPPVLAQENQVELDSQFGLFDQGCVEEFQCFEFVRG